MLMVVYLVGAGPGDPELITLKAIRVLEGADVVIYDRLAGEEILRYAPDDARLIYVGKRAGKHHRTQDEINSILVEEGKKHETVVRLKGGDPFVFGRGGEEILALKEAGIPYRVIPGVTSAVGVPTSVGLPVTHRGVATSFTVVTGHEDPSKPAKQVHWDYNADTLIILMGVGNIRENMEEIMKHRPADTPVCVIESGTLDDERIILGTLGDIADKDLRPPGIIVVGDVVNVYREIRGTEK
jgi:uroporphyrin-III C-methyltransferase